MAYILEGGQWQIKSGDQCLPLLKFCEQRDQAFYLYDIDDASHRARRFMKSGAQVHYAMKANSCGVLLKALQNEGLGVDVVSRGELTRALEHGFHPKKVIFSGVGKDNGDLEYALKKNILQINVESFEELQLLEEVARAEGRTAAIALRLNILLSAPTHKHVQTSNPDSKFGLDMRQLPDVLSWLKTKFNIRLESLTVHIGSQILDLDVFSRMSIEMARLYQEVKAQGFPLARLDLGGGFGIDYHSNGDEDLARLERYFEKVLPPHQFEGGPKLLFEPGRFLVARMGVLLAKVIYVKQAVERKFLILNTGMNALMRPALYQSYHRIMPLKPSGKLEEPYKIVGPICESTDTFAESRDLPQMSRGDWVAIFDAGAYGAVMANTYNESPLPEQLCIVNGKLENT